MRENKLDSCYIRPLLFYSYGNLGLVPKACPVELAISAWEWAAYLGENAARGVNAYIVPWRRVHHTQFNMSAKLGGVYVQSTICGLEAREQGFDEAIFLNMEGRVAEGPGQNIFIVKGDTLVTNGRSESGARGHHPDEPPRDRRRPRLQDRRRPDHQGRPLRRRRGLLLRDGRRGHPHRRRHGRVRSGRPADEAHPSARASPGRSPCA
ncbi:MAG: aminotransferase class IV [Comamonadaceae bacterium]|nr:aminotransferase class IV [Comamonadaceae bacterium]